MTRKLQLAVLIITFITCTGCTRPITGKIVDAETGQPIEGAVLLVEWTKVHGFGMTYTSSEKAIEVLSDKNGIVNIPGHNDPTAQCPDVTIYKPRYVAWNSQFIFPGYTRRTDFSWKDGFVFRLERFKQEYTYKDHTSFIYSTMNTANIEQKQRMHEAFEWERVNSNNEMNKIIEMNKPNRGARGT